LEKKIRDVRRNCNELLHVTGKGILVINEYGCCLRFMISPEIAGAGKKIIAMAE
jgi:hypothetical protein